MRLFVAVNVPEAERQRLFDLTSPLRSGRYPFRWVMPESMHVTLCFLGQVIESDVARIRDTLAVVAGRHARLSMAVGGVGAFPQLRRPRVIWVGVDGGDALLALQADVERSLEPLGFEREQRAWSPHLTLGRAEPHTRQTSFAGLAALADSVTYEATVDVESVDLMRSHVGRGGARYERIAGPRLRGAMTPSKQEAGT